MVGEANREILGVGWKRRRDVRVGDWVEQMEVVAECENSEKLCRALRAWRCLTSNTASLSTSPASTTLHHHTFHTLLHSRFLSLV